MKKNPQKSLFVCYVSAAPRLAVILFVLVLGSCDLLFNTGGKTENASLDPLGDGEFYAQNLKSQAYYKLQAEQLAEGDTCVVWAEKGSRVTNDHAKEIVAVYDSAIRPKVVEYFSSKNFTYIHNEYNETFTDMLDYAHWLAGGNNRGKLTILLLDIQDSFTGKKGDSYVAGYFYAGNFWPEGKIEDTSYYSNARDMIYIDTYPALNSDENRENAYATLAHELQHLISYVTSVALDRDNVLDTWIDEGLSSQAEYLYLGEQLKEKSAWFNADASGTIVKGNNFYVWGNHQEINNSNMDDYATVYLFFRWLYLRAPDELKPSLLYNIETADSVDYKAVTAVAGKINSEWNNWESLLRTWFAANNNPASSEYGYTGDPLLVNIKVKQINGKSVSLYPGEGVYSSINGGSVSPSGKTGAHIKYAGLNSSSGIISTGTSYLGTTLLTFNANTVNNADAESGFLTGGNIFRSAVESNTVPYTGPLIMDAADIIGRNQPYLPLRRKAR